MKADKDNNHDEPRSSIKDPKELHQELKIEEWEATHFLAQSALEWKSQIGNPTDKGMCNKVDPLGRIGLQTGPFQVGYVFILYGLVHIIVKTICFG